MYKPLKSFLIIFVAFLIAGAIAKVSGLNL